ncbi:hypothetical protein B5807_00311 [Epicoccum nigrum]|uniref:Uncharacterized protein n=1 Tax=Epicoccum nigrum TaxID=105696 RepID=A0A1Y2MED2_EPING|nr:hypothetical protein B5807_00311 [Epicoccum nigrum]
MGSLPSKRPATHLGARLTSVTIEKYYNALARRRTAGEQANSSEQSHDDQINNKDTNNASSSYGSKIREITDNNDTKKASDAHLFKETPKCDTTAITPKRVGSKVLRNVGTRPDDRGMANLYRDSAPHILKAADKCRIDRALILTIKSGFDSKRLTEAAMAWIKKHPWEPAAVFVPLAFLACMPSILGTAGFRAGGIAPDSVAADIQASIGNVAADSTFAVLTSAAMGGYGATIVFGSVWAVPTVCLGATAAWKRWRGARNRKYSGVAAANTKSEQGLGVGGDVCGARLRKIR